MPAKNGASSRYISFILYPHSIAFIYVFFCETWYLNFFGDIIKFFTNHVHNLTFLIFFGTFFFSFFVIHVLVVFSWEIEMIFSW